MESPVRLVALVQESQPTYQELDLVLVVVATNYSGVPLLHVAIEP